MAAVMARPLPRRRLPAPWRPGAAGVVIPDLLAVPAAGPSHPVAASCCGDCGGRDCGAGDCAAEGCRHQLSGISDTGASPGRSCGDPAEPGGAAGGESTLVSPGPDGADSSVDGRWNGSAASPAAEATVRGRPVSPGWETQAACSAAA